MTNAENQGPLFWFDPTPAERLRAWLKWRLFWRPICWVVPARWLWEQDARAWKGRLAEWAYSGDYVSWEIAAGRAR
jgi:hypothetical protein